MSSTRPVPETAVMGRDELSADDAWRVLRVHGGWHLLRDAFIRFRYGDGFSHSRALALQLCLAAVPFLIALIGLSGQLGVDSGGKVVTDTVLALTPVRSEDMVNDVLNQQDADTNEFALWVGLLTGVIALVTALAQIERGANRMYGVERDRPALAKYGRATVLSLAVGIPAAAGFLVLVAGGPLGAALERTYRWGDTGHATWNIVRFPLGLLLTVVSVAVIFERSPRRHQPGVSWLSYGAALTTSLWWLTSLAVGFYVRNSGSFGDTYGPLTAVMALLLWANFTGIAIFFGLAFAAQLEALRVGVPEPNEPDLWDPDDQRSNPTSVPRPVAGQPALEHCPEATT